MASAQQVDVKVEDGLPGVCSHVEDRAIAVFDAALLRDFCRGQMAETNDGRLIGGGFF